MQLEYSLDENDYLQYQLYAASKSKNIKSQRRKSFIILVILLLVLFFASIKSGQSFPYPIVILIVLLFAIYKWYETKRYINHYRKNIAENYRERFGLISTLIFGENQIIEESKLGESKINYESLSQITEIQDYYFLKLITGQSLIIPKKVIPNQSDFTLKLEEIKDRFNLENNVELDWKWK